MKKLKPRPFCGGEAEIKVRYDICRQPACFEPHCDKYGCQGSVGFSYGNEEAAIESWNARTPEIIRCGECVYWEPENCRNPNILMQDQQMTYDDFCSWGERREENE